MNNMKKFLSLLFVLVLSLSFVACGSTKVKGELVTDFEDVVDYFDRLDIEDLSYKFTVKYEYTEKDLEEKYQESYTVKGGFNYDTSVEVEPLTNTKFYTHVINSCEYTLTYKETCTFATIDGKEKSVTSIKTSAVYDRNRVYSDKKYSYKDPYETTSYRDREYFDGDFFVGTSITDPNYIAPGTKNPLSWSYAEDATIENLISTVTYYVDYSSMFFLNDDDLTIVYSDDEEHVVIEFKCERSRIETLTITYKTAYETTTINVKVCDTVEVESPKSLADYENVDPDNYYPY